MGMKRLAIIGLGAVTQNIHLPAYAQLGEAVEVVAGCDPNPQVRQKLSSRLPVLFEDAASMLEATTPDLVAICTPPALHRQQTLQALAHGCHVFCEKPMAPTLADAQAMIAAAAEAERQLVVNTQFPFMQIYQAAKAQLGTPAFGRLLFMHAWQTFRRTATTEAGWRGDLTRRLGFEFGVHVFELIRFFFDAMPETVMAHMPRPLAEEKADVVNTLALGFADGRGAAVVLDRLSQGPHRYLEMSLDGEHGTMHTSIGGEARVEMGLHAASRRPFFQVHAAKGGTAALYQGDRRTVLAREGFNPFATATARHLRQFLAAITDGTVPQATGADNIFTLALAFAAYASADEGRTIHLPTYLEEQLGSLDTVPSGERP